ncbi:MAG: hypothetical protein LPK88_13795 [Alphaproteobacteria bacterium]|nr:hypothetical protein [Alphaproteobacteria bacterium]MDX5417376.1 hypothetical protein [Alphaproteobacteria bacterium]MDX5494845.1 hypothetical protein [Alphaproteobacteria bacterium]
MIRKALLALCIAAPLAACGDTEQEADATRAAASFYDIVLSERASGVPDADMRAKLRPVISPDLDSLLAQAAEAERRHTERVNNEEPPYMQGDIFSSLFEGATGYEISGCSESGSGLVECEVQLVHDAEDPVQWKDRVTLAAADGNAFLVDDIAYGGDWDFASKGTLKEALRAVIAAEE